MGDNFKWGVTLCEVPQEYKENDIEKIKEMNVGWVRLHFSWRHIEKEKGVFDFSFYDALFDKIREKNLLVVAAVGCGFTHMLPDWINEENKEHLNLLSYIPQLSRYVHEVVSRFKGKVDIWQAENEINQTSFHAMTNWRQKGWILNPAAELSVLVCILSGIKACDPSAKMMINLECDNPNWYPLIKFYIKNKLPFDIIGVDLYPCYSPAFSPSDPIYSCPDRILQMAEILRKASKFKKEVIVAETGYPAPEERYSLENHASFIHQACQATLTTEAQGIFIWEFRDQHSKGPEFPEYYFGLYDYNGKAKPVLEVYKEEIAGQHQTILVSVKGLIFRNPIPCVDVYINDKLAGKTNLDGMLITQNLSPGQYKVGIKKFFWQQRVRQIKVIKGIPQLVRFFI